MKKIKSNKIITAGMLGNSLEYYDFTLFVFLAPVIGPLFFPSEDKIASLLAFLGTFAVGYIVRPLGAIAFGHIGDKYGRKQALTISILLMGIPTFLMGLLPSYETLGVLAPIALIILRVLQGLCTGGEYNGAGIFVVENVEPHRAGFAGGMISASSAIGALLGSIAASICTLTNMPSWAWRVAFLFGIVIGFVGYYIRRHITDKYLSEILNKKSQHVKFPILDVMKKNPSAIFCTIGISAFAGIVYNISMKYVSVYLTTFQKWPPSEALFVMSFGIFGYITLAPLTGWISDKVGGKVVMATGAIATLLGIYPFLSLLSSESTIAVIAAQLVLVALAAWFQGPMNLFMANLFPAERRYSGVAFSYSMGLAIFGGTAPVVSTFLTNWTRNPVTPAYYVMFSAILAFVCVVQASRNTQRNKEKGSYTSLPVGAHSSA
ncbi:MAG: MFS transporter [Alphaproteobacteria bacterium]|nr:MFS transporter [Alphaproteobacteria bacterium]